MLEGLLYSEELAWAITGPGGSHPYTLAVEVEADPNQLRGVTVIHLGGERQLHRLALHQDSLIDSRLAALWRQKWRSTVDRLLLAVATPALLDPEAAREINTLNPVKAVEEALRGALEKAGVRVSAVKPITRCMVAGLAPGYDMAANMPRPYYPAILPGCVAEVEGHNLSPANLYEHGLGLYKDLGWGTVAPLPPTLKQCIETIPH